MKVEALMSRRVVTLGAQDTVKRALDVMHDFEIRHIPVTRETELIGLVSDRDLREYTVPTLVQVRDPGQHSALMSTPLDEVMRVGLVCVERDDYVRAAITIMLDYHVGAVPVVEPGTKTLCGIISYVDVLKVAKELV